MTIFIAGATMMSVSMGARQAQGLLIGPLSTVREWPLATFSMAVAVHNLMWGLFQPFTGAAADRWGAAKVAAVGAFAFGLGMVMVATGGSWQTVIGLGVLSGFGLAATSFSVVLGPIGRAVSAEHRTVALGMGSAMGSLGMMLLIPVTQEMITVFGPVRAIWGLSFLSFASIPMAMLLHKGEKAVLAAPAERGQQSIKEALKQASCDNGYRFLAAGFFVCGFQLAFIGVHLPGYLALCGMNKGAGATALLVIGGFNVIGTYGMGKLSQRYPPKYVLSAIYLGRAIATFLFAVGPKNEFTLLLFAAT
ncbi:MAG TPA: MFS transporter, partial [Rhodospirillaceae bacterium]|nr:MFS transporter [Rhodospirillaceae bacterium]